MNKRFITPEQRAYVIAHLNDRPRIEVARKAGMAACTMYRIIHENGGEIDYSLSRKDPEMVRYIIEHYDTMTPMEIRAAIGCAPTTLVRWAKKLGLKHSKEMQERIKAQRFEELHKSRETYDYGRNGRKLHLQYLHEYERYWQGKPQQTNLRLMKTTHRAYKAIWYLTKRWNYKKHPTDPYVLLITPETNRSPRENLYVKRYKLDFQLINPK